MGTMFTGKAIQTLLEHPSLTDCLDQMHASAAYVPLTLTSEGSSTVGCHCWKTLCARCVPWERPDHDYQGSTQLMQTNIRQTYPPHVQRSGPRPCGRTTPRQKTLDLHLGAPAWVHKELKPSSKYKHGGSWVRPCGAQVSLLPQVPPGLGRLPSMRGSPSPGN